MQNRPLILEARSVLMQLADVITALTAEDYTQKLPLLSNASVGEHTRHVIELFQQLLAGYEVGTVDYDNRKRNVLIQEHTEVARACILSIVQALDKLNKPLSMSSVYAETGVLKSNYDRELMYNIEHCVHHQAIMKIGLLRMNKGQLDENFGVAKATIQYRNECMQ